MELVPELEALELHQGFLNRKAWITVSLPKRLVTPPLIVGRKGGHVPQRRRVDNHGKKAKQLSTIQKSLKAPKDNLQVV